jgi:hypothetical protein
VEIDKPLTIANISLPDQRYTQRDLSAAIESKDRKTVLATASGDDLLRMQNMSHESWLFLQAKPIDEPRIFSNKIFACGMQRYLGIDMQYALAGMDTCPHDNVDMEHHIVQTCRRGGCSCPRHEQLVHAIMDSVNTANTSETWALANPNIRLKKPANRRKNNRDDDAVCSDDGDVESGTLKPADLLVNGNRMFDVTVVDPCTQRARTEKHHLTPGVGLRAAIAKKKTKYDAAVAEVNGELVILAWTSYGMPHYFVKKSLKPLLKDSKFAWFQLRVHVSCIIFRAAGVAVHNHTLDRNELVPVQRLTLERRDQERASNNARTVSFLSSSSSAGGGRLLASQAF